MNTTKILGEAVGIQRQDIIDRTEEQTAEGLTGAVILGRFKRGRVDAPMAIHQGNIRGQLGHDPKNPDYIAVQDCLDAGVPSVQVLRLGQNEEDDGSETDPPDGKDRFVISCTPPEVQQRIVLNKVRDTLPFLTFNNVVFDIYINGIPAASGVSLLDAAVMDLHGLKVEDLTGNGRKISITPTSGKHKAFELMPTMGSFADDTDIEEGHVVVEKGSFHFCLAAAPLPAENWDIEYVQGGQTFREKTGSYINDSLKANMQLTSLTINSTVETVGSGAFEGCNLLTDLVLMDGIKTLRNQAFNRCSSLRSFSLPPSIEWIDSYIFNNCSSLEHAAIPDSVKYLGDGAFQNCTSLKSASVGNGIKLVEAQLFRGCSALKTVTLGNNVERIQIDSFYDCPVLESVTLPTAVPPAVFSGGMEDYAHLKFYVPADAVSAYQMAANWSEIAGSIFAMP